MKKLIAFTAAALSAFSIFASSIQISVEPGKEFKAKRNPQIAIWLEKSDGTFCQTLFVTKCASEKSWICSPKAGRPESLPVWYFASKNNPAKKAENSEILDAVTTATPKASINFTRDVELNQNEKYIVKAEINNSFDYNENWPKKAKKTDGNYSGVNGQPSVVFSSELPASGEIQLKMQGTGSISGSDGQIYSQLDLLTTAKEIIKTIYVNID